MSTFAYFRKLSVVNKFVSEALLQVVGTWIAVAVRQHREDPEEEEVGSDFPQNGRHLELT